MDQASMEAALARLYHGRDDPSAAFLGLLVEEPRMENYPYELQRQRTGEMVQRIATAAPVTSSSTLEVNVPIESVLKAIVDLRRVVAVDASHRGVRAQWGIPENYKTITYDLETMGDHTVLTLSQDTADETAKDQSEKHWRMVFDGLKKLVESS